LLTIWPAVENKRSLSLDVAGAEKYFFARVVSKGHFIAFSPENIKLNL